MRKGVLVMYLLALGMSAEATSPQKLAWIAPMNGEVRSSVSFNTAPDTELLGYFSFPTNLGGIAFLPDTLQSSTYFDPSDFTDEDGYQVGYPLEIIGVIAFFYEDPDHLWDNDKFQFIIYGDDGATELHKSSLLKAVKNTPDDLPNLSATEYIIGAKPIEFTEGTFWIALRVNASSGYPSIPFNDIPYGYSYIGKPGAWDAFDIGEFLISVLVIYTPIEGVEELSTTFPLTVELVGSPVHNQAEICYSLNKSGPVSLEIFDASGRPVRRLVSQKMEKGEYAVVWEGTNNQGLRVPNGAYFCRLSSGGSSIVKKIVLVK